MLVFSSSKIKKTDFFSTLVLYFDHNILNIYKLRHSVKLSVSDDSSRQRVKFYHNGNEHGTRHGCGQPGSRCRETHTKTNQVI